MESLSQFVQKKREKLGLSPTGLAMKSGVSLYIIEEIEAGKELFLSATVRQNLAKGLKCSSVEIKIHEKEFIIETVSMEEVDVLKQRILNGETELYCPKCRSALKVRIERMYDAEDNIVLDSKAYCSQCVFQIK